jgi:hypothetical protein
MNIIVNKILNVLSFYWLLLVFGVCLSLFFIAVLVKLSLFASYADELILFGILIYAVIKSTTDQVVRYALTLYFMLFIAMVFMSFTALATRGLLAVVLQVFIHLKYILFFVFCWGALGANNSLKLVKIILAVTVFFLIINLLTGSLFNVLFDTKVNLRSGSVRPIGIQADTGSLGTTFALIGCLMISGLKSTSNNMKVILLLAMSVLVLIASTRTALILLPLVIVWWLRDSIKSFVVAFILLVSSFFVIQSSNYMDDMIAITIDNVESTIDDPVASSYIRGIMIYFAFELAVDRFPLGTGAATYGTVMSDNSPVYAEIGLQNSRYFVDKDGIYDSNFASLLGEFGFFGLLLYLFVFYKIIHAPMLYFKKMNSAPEFRFVLFGVAFAYGVTTPIFMNTYPAFILVLVIVASYHSSIPIDKLPQQKVE